jgi:hypothetical protein
MCHYGEIYYNRQKYQQHYFDIERGKRWIMSPRLCINNARWSDPTQGILRCVMLVEKIKFTLFGTFVLFKIVKGIVSCDWGGLLMVSVDRYNFLDIAGKYLFYILKSHLHI